MLKIATKYKHFEKNEKKPVVHSGYLGRNTSYIIKIYYLSMGITQKLRKTSLKLCPFKN